MSGRRNTTEDTDSNILAVFLPIVAVALLVCAGGCYYVERRRKIRLKSGAHLENDRISDTESVISAASARHRPYLLPSATTGRSIRTPSRLGTYDSDSTYGEPPPYSGSSRRSSIASLKALKEDANSRRRRQSSEYPPSEQSLSRSKSLLDLRSNFEPTPLRRSHSSVSLHQRNSGRDSGYADRITYSDDAASSRSGMPSPAQSEWSIRTAPQMATYDMDYIDQRPASVASLPVRGRRGNLRRTRSQPNLTNTLTKTGTYPQGILKRGNTAAKDERPVARHSNSSYLGDRGYGEVGMMQDPREYQQMDNNLQHQKPFYNSNRGRYDAYFGDSNDAYPLFYNDAREDIYGGSLYSAPPSHHSYVGYNKRWTGQYNQQNYDPYNYRNSYWDQQNSNQQAINNPYPYGSTMY